MVAWAQREPGKLYPAWWVDEKRVLIRRIHNLNFVHPELKDGLPDGMTVRRESLNHAGDVFSIYIDGQRVYYANNMKTNAAEAVLAWIEEYRQESEDIMGISSQGLGLLKELAATQDQGMARAAITQHGTVIAALAKNGLLKAKGDRVYITEAGMSELMGLPEFDEPTSPPAPLLEARGEEQGAPTPLVDSADLLDVSEFDHPVGEAVSVDLPEMMASATVSVHEFVQRVAEMNAEISPDERQAEYIQRLADLQQAMDMNDKLIKLVIVDDLELHNFVEHCGSEITAMGGTVIKLELKEALLREVFPPLVKYLEGLNAIGAEYAVFGDLQIVVEQPLDRANELIDFELK